MHLANDVMDRVIAQLVAAYEVEAEKHVINPFVYLLQTHEIFIQCLTDENLISKDTDRSTAADAPSQERLWLVMGLNSLRHFPRWRLVHFRGAIHLMRLMGTFLVMLLAKRLELLLLDLRLLPADG
jgi:hypothetical protein